MSEYVQPILIALAVLLIPACAKLVVNAMKKKLDEGRVIATANAADIKQVLTEHQARQEAVATERHNQNVERFDRIEAQTTTTNGKVAELDKTVIKHEAKIEVLLALATKGQPE